MANYMNPSILDTLARSNPALIERYRQQMGEKNDAIEEAKSSQRMGDYANVAGNLFNDYNNSQKNDVIYKNKFSHLGNAPEIQRAERPKYDGSMISNMTSRGLQQANQDRDKVDAEFKTGVAANEFEVNNTKAVGMNDPASQESEQARVYLKKLVPGAENYPNLDRMSAAQVEKIIPGLYKKYQDDLEAKTKLSSAKDKEPSVSIKDELDLSKNYRDHPVTKATNDVKTSYEKVKKAASNPSAAGDLSLIFGYMKMLDPGSTVREGEFATAQNATGVPQQAVNMYNKALTGERLGAEQRQDFINQAKNIYDAQMTRQGDLYKEFSGTAQGYGMNSQRAFGAAPQPGGGEKIGGKETNAGKIVNVNGVQYKVAADGDTLLPITD